MTEYPDVDNVHLVPTDRGAFGWSPEPRFDPEWPEDVEVRWRVALCRASTGLNVSAEPVVADGGVMLYDVRVRGDRCVFTPPPLPLARLRDYLYGVQDGTLAARDWYGVRE